MAEIIFRRRQVEQLTGLSRSSIYERLNPRSRYYDADFPKPVQLGARAVGWRASEIAAWIESRKSPVA
jgi:prophage regulatory protein